MEESTPAPVEDFSEQEEKNEIKLQQVTVEKQIQDKFNITFVRMLKRLSYYLSKVGLPFEEACKMVRYDPVAMKGIIKENPIIQELIELKELEYKAGLISTVSEKARTGNDKLALWLLEKRFPEEFNKRKGGGGSGNDDADLLGMAVEYIQKSGDNSPLVTEKSGKAFIIKRGALDSIRKLGDFLK